MKDFDFQYTELEKLSREYAANTQLRRYPEINHPCDEIRERHLIEEDYLAGFNKAKELYEPRWIKCSEQMPKNGDEIVLRYPINRGSDITGYKYSWVAGIVDGSDDGLFVDYELDGQEIKSDCFWFSIPQPKAEGSHD
jgi:hypothetical protein